MNINDIEVKVDYPEKIEKTVGIDSKYKLKADEINAVISFLKYLQNSEADPFANYEANKL